ncbi:hypothetical protein TL18_06475 [Methanobrevibacter sp. YE315]|uniref:winged helix-turn-helix transcriptional regulator n=1 Tax=Methanobrevibacter sp. YE315 TaxID=1609968 RepID=UPI000764DCB3|nr:helix-turn-helix domain-containing protein [Methanobrevibacter sp. YE315]AMD17697.1 hypothetical protein TL18_06475 [Methanobrevibacter sp. YE315]
METEDICPVGDTLDLFNRKWIFCILSNIFYGAKHFKEFKELNLDISNHVLSQTLKYMVENGLISKVQDGNKTIYDLTEKGFKANKIIFELACYSLDELKYSSLEDSEKIEIKESYKKTLKLTE